MSRRRSGYYTVLITYPGQETIVFSIRPLTLMVTIGLVVGAIVAIPSFYWWNSLSRQKLSTPSQVNSRFQN